MSATIPYDEIDVGVRRIVQLIYAFPGIATAGSCSGHGNDHEAEIDFIADTQEHVAALFRAMPQWGWQGGFANNQPITRAVWATVAPAAQGLSYKLRLSAYPSYERGRLLEEVEGTLADALPDATAGRTRPCSTTGASDRSVGTATGC